MPAFSLPPPVRPTQVLHPWGSPPPVPFRGRRHSEPTGKYTAAQARRKAALAQRTPVWADHPRIAALYRLAKQTGLVVDHVLPLRGKRVSGLHVYENLRPLTFKANLRKANRFTPR